LSIAIGFPGAGGNVWGGGGKNATGGGMCPPYWRGTTGAGTDGGGGPWELIP